MKALLPVALAALFVACDLEMPRVKQPSADDVSLPALVAEPGRYHGALIRVTGWSRLEFEGNAIYLSAEDFTNRTNGRAVWLSLGWPVEAEVRAMDGKRVVAEGRFSVIHKGHDGAFVGSLEDVHLAVASAGR